MGIFSGIFGSKEKSSSAVETTLEYLPLLIEKDFSARRTILEEFVANKMAEIKYAHGKCTSQLVAIEKMELEDKPNARFNKAAATSKRQFDSQMQKLLQKLDPKDRGNTVDDARHYAGESYMLLFNEINSFRKNIAYTSVYLKDEMKVFGEALQEILNNLGAMNKEFEKEKELFQFENAKERIGKIIKMREIINDLEGQKIRLAEEHKQKELALEKQKTAISEMENGEGMKEMKSLEEEKVKLMGEKQDLKTEVLTLLASIDRPMQRFKALVDSGRWKLNDGHKEYLTALSTNPMLVLKGDPRAFTLKQILGELKKAIEEEKVELKDKEKEKRLSAIDEIMTFNFFEKVFWKLNEVQKKQVDIEKALLKSSAPKIIASEQKKATDLEREIHDLKQKIGFVEKEQIKTREDMEKEQTLVLGFACTALGKTVVIKDKATDA